MPRSPRTLVCVIALLVVLATATFLYVRPETGPEPTTPGKPLAQAAGIVAPQTARLATTPAETAAPEEPSEFVGFSADTPDIQLARVTALQSNPNLAPEVLDFLSAVLADRSCEQTIRNNAANALLNQPQPDPYLHRRFIAMIDDPTEEYEWREFAVQHLAVSHRTSAEREVIIDKLMRLVRDGDKGIPGTALLHLHRLEDDGAIALDDGYADLLVSAIDDPSADLMTRMTAAGIAGERRERRALPSLRLLATTGIAALRRVSLAALGLIGEADDLEILRQAATSDDPGVRAAASAAIVDAGSDSKADLSDH